MKPLIVALSALLFPLTSFAEHIPVSIVTHRWQEKITESNHAALRPGSIYDIHTYFEQNLAFPNPQFNYLFHDTGLGATDPIYPVFQSGYQRSWAQLIKAGLSEKNRHIDHRSVGQTPEGCEILSTYWVRHINEFPDMYHRERAEGYTLVDISFDYYRKLHPGAQCGKHFAHEPDSKFQPFEAIDKYADKFKTMADIPPKLLAKYEAKIGILKQLSEEFSKTKWPRYSKVYNLRDNSMWFYPDGFAPDYGINKRRPQRGLASLSQPKHLVIETGRAYEEAFPLRATFEAEGFAKVLNFIDGKPFPGFDEKKEPGRDTLKLSQVTRKNLYTAGIEIEPIRNVRADVSNPENFRLASVVFRPFEPETDMHFSGIEKIPQVRFVYQMIDPRNPKRAFEQLFIHLNFDAVDRLAPPAERAAQIQQFLADLDALTAIREGEDKSNAEAATMAFIRKYSSRPVQTVAWSSSLTGIWVFGSLTRSYNAGRELQPLKVVRAGVDVGYYSTAYDTVLFRAAAKKAKGKQRKEIQQILTDITPKFYRDPRRHDPHALGFHRVTCAQCHQVAGRDGVHMALNDHLDRRIKTNHRATEFLFRELDRQLKGEAPPIGQLPANLEVNPEQE